LRAQAHFAAALQGGPDAAERGALGNRALLVLRELLRLLPSWEGVAAEASAFLGAALQAAAAVAGSGPAGARSCRPAPLGGCRMPDRGIAGRTELC
jgi:hypothetical protein